MRYSRQQHSDFLEEELRSQTERFKQILNTSALYLLKEREELFVAQYMKFEDGEMILKFSTKRSLPRKGEYLYCFTIPKELRNYRNWNNLTYGDLIKNKGIYTELVCIWHGDSKKNDDFYIAGFRGVSLDFQNSLINAQGLILILGPNKPPYEYIANLQTIVENDTSTAISNIIDQDFNLINTVPLIINKNSDIASFVINQLNLIDTIILIGPPGTGKTYQIANICEQLAWQGKSVLVTSLTNRALIEVASKPALRSLLNAGNVIKLNLSVDEKTEIPLLKNAKEMHPIPGSVILSTFYITSMEAVRMQQFRNFDYVIMDEASQALFAMFALSKIMGKKNIWIGDTNQLPPVVSINKDKVIKKNYTLLIDGLKTISTLTTVLPTYQLTETRRLSERAARYTSIFYHCALTSFEKNITNLSYKNMLPKLARLFHPSGGPTLIKTTLQVSDKKPESLVNLSLAILAGILKSDSGLNIAILTYYKETSRAIQKKVSSTIGNHNNVLIETVSRVQGLTTDIVLFLVPNVGYNYSLDKHLFNVATSRAKRHTFIIADKNIIVDNLNKDKETLKYLEKLDKEYAFEFSGAELEELNKILGF